MSDMHPDLVIQISASDPDTTGATAMQHEDCRLISELKQCLQPGVEIALVFEGYMAMTSILWLSDLQSDGSMRAGIRLLGVSALPDKRLDAPSTWDDASHGAVPAPVETAAIIRQHL